MYKHDCLDGNRTRRLPVFVFHNNMFRGCVKNHMKHNVAKVIMSVLVFTSLLLRWSVFINYAHESTGRQHSEEYAKSN